MDQEDSSCSCLTLDDGTKVYYQGPGVEEGALPAFFYFSLSGEDSLCLNPFNQPVRALEGLPLRTFSISLPYHDTHDKKEVVEKWVQEIRAGHDIITPFIDHTIRVIQTLIDQNIIEEDKIAAGGLSRGGFIATHLAAREPRIKAVVGFAPLTMLRSTSFVDVREHPLAEALNLLHLQEKLYKTPIRYYISNRDEMVSTDFCFQVIREYTECSYAKGVRAPPFELVVSRPIGYKGHGTPPQVFKDGAKYIQGVLL